MNDRIPTTRPKATRPLRTNAIPASAVPGIRTREPTPAGMIHRKWSPRR